MIFVNRNRLRTCLFSLDKLRNIHMLLVFFVKVWKSTVLSTIYSQSFPHLLRMIHFLFHRFRSA